MDVLVERCAGVDVHRDNVVATVRVPGTGRRRVDQQTRTFAATLGGLAQHMRNVPGRKTDVKDSEWICQLVAHGLVRPSFVPPPEI